MGSSACNKNKIHFYITIDAPLSSSVTYWNWNYFLILRRENKWIYLYNCITPKMCASCRKTGYDVLFCLNQGWEFALWFFVRIARFLTKKKSKTLFRSFCSFRPFCKERWEWIALLAIALSQRVNRSCVRKREQIDPLTSNESDSSHCSFCKERREGFALFALLKRAKRERKERIPNPALNQLF